MKNNFTEVLRSKKLVLNEHLTSRHIDALEYLYSQIEGTFTIVDKEAFGENVIQLKGLNNLKYGKKLLLELLEKGFFTQYSKEGGKGKIISRGNILVDFIGFSDEEKFTIRWNPILVPTKPIALQKQVHRASRVFYLLQNLLKERLGIEEKITFSISLPELRRKLAIKEGQYSHGGQFLYPTFVNSLIAPNIRKIAEVNDLFIAFERVVLENGTAPLHGLTFSIARKPTFNH